MRKAMIFSLLLLLAFAMEGTSYAGAPEIFDIVVLFNLSDTYDYDYEVRYSSDTRKQFGISHWWLEINCAHQSIDESSIYGYTDLESGRINWTLEFAKLGDPRSVNGYDDWVIKWDLPTGIDIPKGPNNLIGYFGFHSTQPPVPGMFGGNGAQIFDEGPTTVPKSMHGNDTVPEPSTLFLIGAGLLGAGLVRRKKT